MTDNRKIGPIEDPSVQVGITKGIARWAVPHGGGVTEIAREQDTARQLTGYWARTSRPCPPSCLQPIAPVPGVVPIGELELLEMLCAPDAIVVDSRKPEWIASGTIPGSVNIPFGEAAERLEELGCTRAGDGWDCTNARRVALFCNGPWCGQSPAAIRAMAAAGFPAGRIHYYRGGLQHWHLAGLTTTEATGPIPV